MSKSFHKLVFFIIISLQMVTWKKNSFRQIYKRKMTVSKFCYSYLLFAYTNYTHDQVNITKNVVIIVLCSALIGSYIHFRKKQKRQFSKFRGIIRNLQKSTSDNSEILPGKNDSEPDFNKVSVGDLAEKHREVSRKRNESLMTSETETKLLELLNEFEKGDLYNSKNMSLPFLAGELNTNTKYLSYVINQHKCSDFKTYINRLRINYIVGKLINDEKYRQYKISILAEECGFSSHSKFASVFKMVTDYSPSAYIKLLDADNQSDIETRF